MLISLAPTTLVAGFSFWGERDKCVSEEQAKSIFLQAEELENLGRPQDARRKYKIIDNLACGNYGLRAVAFNKALAIEKIVNQAYTLALIEMENYYSLHGTYPRSKGDLRQKIPESLLPAYDNFRFIEKESSQPCIITGI